MTAPRGGGSGWGGSLKLSGNKHLNHAIDISTALGPYLPGEEASGSLGYKLSGLLQSHIPKLTLQWRSGRAGYGIVITVL